MTQVLAQMSALVLCGVWWRVWRPQGLDADTARRVLAELVYFFLMPALMLSVLWQAPLDRSTLAIAGTGAAAIAFGVVLAWVLGWGLRLPAKQQGAVLLAIAFPNTTYLGLPVLEQTFGAWARSVVVQIDLFAATPLVWTLGVGLASYYGNGGRWGLRRSLRSLASIPAVWAGVGGTVLNLAGLPMPGLFQSFLGGLANAAAPLMLIALGMGLVLGTWQRGYLAILCVTVGAKLVLQPAFAVPVASMLGLEGRWLTAVVMECAMPSMLLGIVLCDRYRLDTNLYALLGTATTALSLLSLPYWRYLLD